MCSQRINWITINPEKIRANQHTRGVAALVQISTRPNPTTRSNVAALVPFMIKFSSHWNCHCDKKFSFLLDITIHFIYNCNNFSSLIFYPRVTLFFHKMQCSSAVLWACWLGESGCKSVFRVYVIHNDLYETDLRFFKWRESILEYAGRRRRVGIVMKCLRRPLRSHWWVTNNYLNKNKSWEDIHVPETNQQINIFPLTYENETNIPSANAFTFLFPETNNKLYLFHEQIVIFKWSCNKCAIFL